MTDGLEAARRSEVADAIQAVRQRLNHRIEWEKQRARGGVTTVTPPNVMKEVTYLVSRVRDEERASESALRAAAQEAFGGNEGYCWSCGEHWSVTREMGACRLHALKNVIDGAPWEPSEEQVERACAAFLDEQGWPEDPITTPMRAALKAALSPPPAGPPASA